MSTQQLRVHTTTFTYEATTEAYAFFYHFVKEYGEDQAFLLDSVTRDEIPYTSSMIGLFPILSVHGKGEKLMVQGERSVLEQLELPRQDTIEGNLSYQLDQIMAKFIVDDHLPHYAFGYLGFFGYDAIRYFEAIPATTYDDREIDDFHLQIHRMMMHFSPEKIVLYVHSFDHNERIDHEHIEQLMQKSHEGIPYFSGYQSEDLQIVEDVSFEEYVSRIEKTKAYIRAGDIFQCVISKRDRIKGTIDPLAVYGRLRGMNPSPYMFYANYGHYMLFGASPEMQVRMEDGIVQMKPIAGTSKGKGKTKEENEKLISALVADEKERAEHVMLVDLCRNDIGRIAQPGTVKVEQLLQIEEYSHVYHLVSLVKGNVREKVSSFDVFLSTFPAGTLSGAPKVRAMEIIDEIEDVHRGPYGGVIGMIDCYGNLDTAIIIRTVVVKDGVSYLQAGAGIVADSDPEQEWRECNHKLGALRATLFA